MVDLRLSALQGYGSVAAIVVAAGLAAPSMAWAGKLPVAFDIPAGNGAKVLLEFSRQAGVQILFPNDLAKAYTAPAIKGAYTPETALAILLRGSGLEIAQVTETTIYLRAASQSERPGETSTEPSSDVVVTGTRIRGRNATSPTRSLGRREIEQSGYSQLGDIIRSLPENFSGGQNPGVIGAGSSNISNDNVSNASTINLRGLGTDATLVLINGHRLSGDSLHQGSDISSIPLAAVQRVEVVPDGASALYGSDAVAGVVNLILRKNLNGGELSLRGGFATQGGAGEQTFSYLQGISRPAGYAIINIEHSAVGGVTAGQRNITAAATPETTLLQPQSRTSLFMSAGRDLTDHIRLSFDGVVSDRRSTAVQKITPSSTRYDSAHRTPAFSAAGTVEVDMPADWNLRIAGVASGSRNVHVSTANGTSGTFLFRNRVEYVETVADGPVFDMPGGTVKVAVGGGYRQEHFEDGEAGAANHVRADRNVSYVFAEASAPMIAASETRTGLHELEINVSGRSERYSDFGSSSNPKVGVRYMPLRSLALRATWGKSFKAPNFSQKYQASKLYFFRATTVGYKGAGTAFMTYGGNPDLKPETSTSWTFGADYQPKGLPSLKVSGTLFGIDYTDRVVQPVANFLTAMSNPLYAPFIEPAPSDSRRAELLAAADLFYNLTGAAPDYGNVVGVVGNMYTNASAQKITGADLSYRQTVALSSGQLSLFANATWLKLTQQTIITAQAIEMSGTVFNPPKFKARAGATWEAGNLAATAAINHIGPSRDTGVTPVADVAAWTTTDLTVSYSFPHSIDHRVLKDVRLVLSASNLFDMPPPRILAPTLNGSPGIYYDSTNASILGRVMSVTLSKAW